MGVKLGNGKWAIKEDKLLAYNDNSGRFFNKEFDFSRGSSATYVAKDGLIKTAADDTPRIDFSDTVKGALLLEPQRTNLITYSEDFSGWNSYQVTSNTTTSPSGSTVYFLDFEDARMFPTTSISNSTTYTSSIYLKANKVANVKIRNARDGDTVISLTTDWVRYEVTAISNSSSTNSLLIDARFSQGLGASGLEIALWGAQLEEGSYATSYIPTFGSTATRLADVCNNSGSAQDFNDSEGVLYFEGSFLKDSRLQVGDGSSTNAVVIGYAGNPFVRIRANLLNSITEFGSGDLNTNVKIAISYKSGDTSFWMNGVAISENTSVFTFTNPLNEIEFVSEGNRFYGNVRELQVFTETLTDEQLQKLTTI